MPYVREDLARVALAKENERLRRALTELLEVCKCENNCKKYDRSCATRRAEWVLRGGDPYKNKEAAQ